MAKKEYVEKEEALCRALAEITKNYRGKKFREAERSQRIQAEIDVLSNAGLSLNQLIAECAMHKVDHLMTIERFSDINKIANITNMALEICSEKHTKGLPAARENAARNKSERAKQYHQTWKEWAANIHKAHPDLDLLEIAGKVAELAKNAKHFMANKNEYSVKTIRRIITGTKNPKKDNGG